MVRGVSSGMRTPWGSAYPQKRPGPSKNVPNTYITHNMAQMGMVVHAPKAKNDRIIDLFLVLDPKTVPRRIWAVSKDMGPGYGGLRCPLTAWGLGVHVWYL